MRDRTIVVNNKNIKVDDECEFVFYELIDIYQTQADDAGIEWNPAYEEFVYSLARDIILEVDEYRADLITNEPTHCTPWDED